MKKFRNKTGRFATVCLLAVTVMTTACGGTQNSAVPTAAIEGLEGLGAVTVISREEGSGTRETFAEKTGLLQTDETGKRVDLTSADAVIKMDAEAVLSEVAANTGAVGYVSMGALKEESSGIRTVCVDGVAPDPANAEKGSYPLERAFYVAYSGVLSETATDFMTYLLSKGQEIVADGYTPVKKSATFLSDKSSGTIHISGSTSVAPLMEKLAEDYKNYNPNAEITVEATDSTSGLTAAMQGSCDLAMSSRDLKDYEKELLDEQEIAGDMVAVIVNAENPAESLTTAQLEALFSGTAANWSDLNQ